VDGPDAAGVAGEGGALGFRSDIPDAHCGALACRRQRPTIGRERDCECTIRIPWKPRQLTACRDVPKKDLAAPWRGERASIRREGCLYAAVPKDCTHLTASHIPELDGLIVSGRSERLPVRRK